MPNAQPRQQNHSEEATRENGILREAPTEKIGIFWEAPAEKMNFSGGTTQEILLSIGTEWI